MRALDSVLAVNNSTNIGAFVLNYGGLYAVDVSATFGGGTVELQTLGPDGSTYVSIKNHFANAGALFEGTIGSFVSNGMFYLRLTPGTYKFVITTATAVYARVTRIPGE